jgi:hypothetical protein
MDDWLVYVELLLGWSHLVAFVQIFLPLLLAVFRLVSLWVLLPFLKTVLGLGVEHVDLCIIVELERVTQRDISCAWSAETEVIHLWG